MTGIGIVIPGSGPGLGPIIPSALPSAGVAGYTHRYAAARVPGADTSIVSAWPDAGSDPEPMSVRDGAGSATLRKTGAASPFVRLTDILLDSFTTEAAPVSFALVCRRTSPSGVAMLPIDGGGLYRAGDGTFQLSVGPDSIYVPGSSGWSVLVATVVAGGPSRLTANGSSATGTLTATGSSTTQMWEQGGGQLDVMEAIVWSGQAFTADQHALVRAAMKAAHSDLP